MRFTLGEVSAAVGGRLGTDADPSAVVSAVSQDSRSLPQGSLFVPLIAERDGHDFVADALRNGATAYLTGRPDQDGPCAVHVEDTFDALCRLGHGARQRVVGPVVAVTGSAGKTSTKDLIRAALARRGTVGASEKSFNNEIGVPLTLVNTPDDAWAAVVEIGARFPGNIAAGCVVARPTVGVVTNVGTAHLETFGSRAAIAATKGEILDGLGPGSVAVLPVDDDYFDTFAERASGATILSFGTGADALVKASMMVMDDDLRPTYFLETPWGSAEVRLGARGHHQVNNSLAAAAAALSCGVSLDDVVTAFLAPAMSPWRTELVRTDEGAVLINDAYNANPDAMYSALSGLAGIRADRRIAVLGTMAELGPQSEELHRNVAARAAELRVTVISVGEPAYGVAAAVSDIDAALELLSGMGVPRAGDAVLVKGSRVAGLERLSERLAKGVA